MTGEGTIGGGMTGEGTIAIVVSLIGGRRSPIAVPKRPVEPSPASGRRSGALRRSGRWTGGFLGLSS
jgi:hypothetical protein